MVSQCVGRAFGRIGSSEILTATVQAINSPHSDVQMARIAQSCFVGIMLCSPGGREPKLPVKLNLLKALGIYGAFGAKVRGQPQICIVFHLDSWVIVIKDIFNKDHADLTTIPQ